MFSLATSLAALAALSGVEASLADSGFAHWVVPWSKPLVIARMDPIVTPGIVGSHVHTVYGAANFRDVLNTPEEQQRAQCTTVQAEMDKSNYWAPTLYQMTDDGYVPIAANGRMYYFAKGKNTQPFPQGMRIVTGTAMSRAKSIHSQAMFIGWDCDEKPFNQWMPNGTNSPDGCNSIHAKIHFPSCGWANQSLDSWDHMSHLTWPITTGGGIVQTFPYVDECPPSHPIKYPQLMLENTHYMTPEQKAMWKKGELNLILSNGDTMGASYHADFVSGWKEEDLRSAMDCGYIGQDLDRCAFFRGRAVKETALTCRYQGMIPDEDNGYFKALKNLPGCNPRWDYGTGDDKPDGCPGGDTTPGWTKPNVAVYDRGHVTGNPVAANFGAQVENDEVVYAAKNIRPATGSSPYFQNWCADGNEWHEKILNKIPDNCGTNQDIADNLDVNTAHWKTNEVQGMTDTTAWRGEQPPSIVGEDKWQVLANIPNVTCWYWMGEDAFHGGDCPHPAPDTMNMPGYRRGDDSSPRPEPAPTGNAAGTAPTGTTAPAPTGNAAGTAPPSTTTAPAPAVTAIGNNLGAGIPGAAEATTKAPAGAAPTTNDNAHEYGHGSQNGSGNNPGKHSGGKKCRRRRRRSRIMRRF